MKIIWHYNSGQMMEYVEKSVPFESFSTKQKVTKNVGNCKHQAIPLKNYLTNEVFYDTLYTEADRVRI